MVGGFATSFGIDLSQIDGDLLSGVGLHASLESVRELKELGLQTIENRMAFEKALRAAQSQQHGDIGGLNHVAAYDEAQRTNPACTGTSGGVYSQPFLDAVNKPLYNMFMGVENMSPFLYALVRFVKPIRCLEVLPHVVFLQPRTQWH